MPDTDDSALIIIDIQDKLINVSYSKDDVVNNTIKLAKAAQILEIPIIITEQYPKGLGTTLSTIKNCTIKNNIIEKTTFSALKTPEFKTKLIETNKKQLVICGIETHICVLQTVKDLISQGFEVFLVKDASSSRKESEHLSGIDIAKQYGAKITTVEITIFEWLKDSKHPKFKEIQALIK